jgi:hypothetical protein
VKINKEIWSNLFFRKKAKMAGSVTIKISRSIWNLIIGKSIILLIIGCFFGLLANTGQNDDLEFGSTLTIEQYTAGYESYRADLLDKNSIWFNLLIGIGFVFFFGGIYELLGRFFGFLTGKIVEKKTPMKKHSKKKTVRKTAIHKRKHHDPNPNVDTSPNNS